MGIARSVLVLPLSSSLGMRETNMKKHQAVHYVLFTMVLACLCGCSNPEKKALNSFKSIINFLSAIRNDDGSRKFSDFSFNVRRTDSVLSPFAGEITFDSLDYR